MLATETVREPPGEWDINPYHADITGLLEPVDAWTRYDGLKVPTYILNLGLLFVQCGSSSRPILVILYTPSRTSRTSDLTRLVLCRTCED